MKFLAASALLAAASATASVGSATAAAPKYTVTVSDARTVTGGVAAPLKTSKDATYYYNSGAVEVKVEFVDPMTALADATDSTKTLVDAANTLTLAVSAPTVSADSRTFTYTLTDVETADKFKVPAGAFKRTKDNVLNGLTEITFTKGANALAEVAPATTNKVALNTAAVGADFWYYIPSGLFANIAGDLEITGGTPSVAGLSVVAGKAGRAAIAGRMTALPSDATATGCWTSKPQVVFTINARDSSGNTASTTLCVGVEASASAASLALGTTPIAYSEAGAATAIFSGTSSSAAAGTVYAYVESPDTVITGEAIQGGAAASAAVAGTSASLIRTSKAITSGGINTELGALLYANNNEGAKGSSALVKRTARAVLTKAATGFTEATEGVVLAVGSRPINFAVVNAAPTYTSAGTFVAATAAAATATTFTENAATEKVLFSDVVIADTDDSDVRYATITITGNYKKGLDLLGVNSFAASEKVTATFNAEKGQLTLSPPVGAQSVSKADMQAVLQKVAWYPAEVENVNGRDKPAGALDRTFELVVVDNAASGLAASANSFTAAGKLTVTSVADAPTPVAAKAYGADGALNSKDAAAESKSLSGEAAPFTTSSLKKHTLVVPANAVTGDVITGTFPIDFSRTADGVYLGGALEYVDLSTTTPALSYTAAVAADYSATPAAGKYTITPSLANNKLDISFTFDATKLGEKDGKITVDGTDLPFAIDIRQRKCPFDAAYAVATHYPDASLCTTPATKSYTAAATTFSLLAGTDTAVADRRGNVLLDLPASATAAATLTAQPANAANLPPLPALEGVQGDLAVSFGPDGTQFNAGAEPTVCINVGSVPAGKKAFLAVSSQANGKFGDWETLAANNAHANYVAGQVLCAKLPHFSVVAPVLVAAEAVTGTVSTANTASKLFQMGASCPNGCSGKGFCREHGQCACFDGFMGYDCSQRTCPFDQSWDVPADGSVTHNEAECSARGACDRKAGVCACFPGFEGAACQRVSCPGDCNGHGKCRLAKEMPAVAASFANKWEAERVQVCQCDAGYQGYDCAERICPFGDDPESVCKDDKRQKQKVTIDFGTVPSTATSAAWTHLNANDELTLAFKTRANHVLNAPTIKDLWSNDATALAASLKDALTSLPEFAVSDVKVAATVAGTSTTASKVDLDFEFTGSSLQWNMAGYPGFTYSSAVAGNTVSGDQNKFMCDLQGATEFINGCVGQGCRPAHKQVRLYEETVVTGSSFATLNDKSVLQQLASNGAVDFNTAGVWGMEVVVTVNSDGSAASYKYEVNAYGQSYGVASEETPLPPTADARKNVPIAHGLFIDFTGIPSSGQHQMVFAWRLPKCSVSITQDAEEQFESVECSKRGSCDRKTGTCKCYPGYSGYNCGAQQIAL